MFGRSKTSFLVKFVCLLVILTNLSQMPVFIDEGKTQLLSVPIWIALAALCLFTKREPNLSELPGVKIWAAVFVLFFLTLSMFDEMYLKSALPPVMGISIFVLVLGTCVGRDLNGDDMDKIYTCYIFSTLAVGVSVYQIYIAGNVLTGPQYLFESKNSMCQILLTAWTMIIFTKFRTENIFLKCIYIFTFLFFTYEICALKSRASLIGMPIVLIIALFEGKVSSSIRRYAMLFLIGAIFLMMNDKFYDFFVENIVYGGRDSSSLDDISSGRVVEWESFIDDFSQSMMFGVGRCKRESLILTSLLEFGLLAGLPILLLALQPVVYSIIKFRLYKHNVHFIILVSLAFTYCLNGVFEQLAPFGPGVKCYFLWFLLGIVSRGRVVNNTYRPVTKYGK